MSGREGPGVLARWSRRKAAAQAAAARAPEEVAAPPLDLPDVETLGAASDYTMFLARGVSAAVQAKALRVAWASDPAIAEFRGMAEYAWDFNAPGYGALSAADNVGALLGQVVRSAASAIAAPPSGDSAVAHVRPPTEPASPAVAAAHENAADTATRGARLDAASNAIAQARPFPEPAPPAVAAAHENAADAATGGARLNAPSNAIAQVRPPPETAPPAVATPHENAANAATREPPLDAPGEPGQAAAAADQSVRPARPLGIRRHGGAVPT